jgi:hypothetical protein
MWVVILSIAGLLGGAEVAEAARARAEAALILDLQGQTTPALQRFAEIAGDTRLNLGKDARITFLHYATCRKVRVKGGSVSFSGSEYRVSGGVVEQESREPCPRTFGSAPRGEAAGLITREVKPRRSVEALGPLLPLQPKFVVLGEKADAYAAVRIVRGGQTVVEVALREREAVWPAGAPALAADADHELVLVPTSLDLPRRSFRVRTQPEAVKVEADLLAIIRLD